MPSHPVISSTSAMAYRRRPILVVLAMIVELVHTEGPHMRRAARDQLTPPRRWLPRGRPLEGA